MDEGINRGAKAGQKEAWEEGGCGIFGGKGGQIDESEGLGDFFERKSCKYEIFVLSLHRNLIVAPAKCAPKCGLAGCGRVAVK